MTLSQQETALRMQPDIVVATPGRIIDLLLNSIVRKYIQQRQQMYQEQLRLLLLLLLPLVACAAHLSVPAMFFCN